MSDKKHTHHELHAAGTAETPVVATATLKVRSQLTWQHLTAAAHFSVKVGEIEVKNPVSELGPQWEEVFVNAAPCVISAAAGVEAYANQIFADRLTRFSKLPANILDDMWTEWIEKEARVGKTPDGTQNAGPRRAAAWHRTISTSRDGHRVAQRVGSFQARLVG